MSSQRPDPLAVLAAFVKAHAVALPNTGTREPILFLKHIGGYNIQHHGLIEDDIAGADEL